MSFLPLEIQGLKAFPEADDYPKKLGKRIHQFAQKALRVVAKMRYLRTSVLHLPCQSISKTQSEALSNCRNEYIRFQLFYHYPSQLPIPDMDGGAQISCVRQSLVEFYGLFYVSDFLSAHITSLFAPKLG